MRRLATTTWLVSVALTTTLQIGAAAASDLVWEVENPFRFFKKPAAFALHEKAYEAVRGKPQSTAIAVGRGLPKLCQQLRARSVSTRQLKQRSGSLRQCRSVRASSTVRTAPHTRRSWTV